MPQLDVKNDHFSFSLGPRLPEPLMMLTAARGQINTALSQGIDLR